ncbi:MAG: glycoside hydrolase family 9 protein [Verrucomicrobiia bacterium]
MIQRLMFVFTSHFYLAGKSLTRDSENVGSGPLSWFVLSLAAVICAHGPAIAADPFIFDANPLEMPAVGSYGLRVLTPTVLELTVINTKDPDPDRVTCWDFVSGDARLSVAAPNEFVVTAGGRTIGVASVGFKRRPLYAPLANRDLRIANGLYLQLASSISENETVQVRNPGNRIWTESMAFIATAAPTRWNPAIHVNQTGYAPLFPKRAMVGYYLGSLGEMTIPTGGGFQLIDRSGKVAYQGQLTRRADTGYTYSPAPYQQVWQADFSAFSTPGEYRLAVPGMGCSFPFVIHEGVAAAFARTYALGVYHQRCGMEQDLPFTRHGHGICHAAPVQVPDVSFTAVNRELANMSGDYAQHQAAPQLKDCNSSLYPFVNRANRDVSGGHHDAGDYSRYTINSAGFIHYLVFAADTFPGVVDLDNLGLPESGDGKSDVLQEAKWEADFLARMQDTDGGFYFLVYPRDREYENDVLPDHGDPQVVFPKTTSVTAAAVAALAEAGSSPAFKRQFPVEAADYLAKARLGWTFLQNAIAKHGKAGAYQKITHYGNEFGHDDELAWAAAALFAATGETAFHTQLKAWFNPSDPNTRRWSWWRMFEGYGCATRTYAFAARSGRISATTLDPQYLRLCEAEIQAAAEDHVRFAQESAYGTSFPGPNKQYRTAGWYFSSERAFDITVAYQLTPRADYLDAVISGLNYEAGCNPVNVSYITGLGSRRQREIVHQYAQNDHSVLPPSGIPLGNVQASYQWLEVYKTDLGAVTFPSDSAVTAPFPYYDRWCDTFNTTTEFVVTDQARSMASLCFWMAQTSLRTQPWTFAKGQITGLPSQIPAGDKVTATLTAEGVDLTAARVVWEARDQEPVFGNPVTFTPKNAGTQWIEAEAQLPDGRRVVAKATFRATTSLATPPNPFQSASLFLSPDCVALFHLDGDLADATGRHGSLTLGGNARLDDSNLGWMADRRGAGLQFDDLGDKAVIQLPSSELRAESGTTAIILEAMVYVDAFVGFNRDSASILCLRNAWDSFLAFGEDKYAGPYVRGGTAFELLGANLTRVLTAKEWHHLALEVNQAGYVARLNGNVIASATSNEMVDWGTGSTVELELGNFAGWIDEVAVRCVRTGAPPNAAPSIYMAGPEEGSTFTAPAQVILTASGADTDGTIAKVEFFAGDTRLGEVDNGAYPFTYVWNGVAAGTYSVAAKATDNRGAVAVSAPVRITVDEPHEAAAAPVISPPGGEFTGSASVTLKTSTGGGAIRYTLDGSEPSVNSPIYAGPFGLPRTATLKAKAFKNGMAPSPTAKADFVVTQLSASGTRVTFVKRDTVTRGNWKGAYGLEGYSVIGDSAKSPAYLQMTTAGKADYSWFSSNEALRGLQIASGNGRVAGVWYSSTSFSVNIDLTDSRTHRVALYMVDWDRGGRAQQVEILDGVTGEVLDSQMVSGFEEGLYCVWHLKGKVRIRLTRLSGANAILAGLFFDPRIGRSDALSVAPLIKSPAFTAQANPQFQVVGEAGQQVVVEASNDLRVWTPLSTNTLASGSLNLAPLVSNEAKSQFFRARAVAPSQPQYVIEASTDLMRWTPISMGTVVDLEALRSADAANHLHSFYRAQTADSGQLVGLMGPVTNRQVWLPVQPQER